MNIETGVIHRSEDAIAAAEARGERLLELTEDQVKRIEAIPVAQRVTYLKTFTGLNRHQRRKLKKLGSL